MDSRLRDVDDARRSDERDDRGTGSADERHEDGVTLAGAALTTFAERYADQNERDCGRGQ
jgi:hypothetical protein